MTEHSRLRCKLVLSRRLESVFSRCANEFVEIVAEFSEAIPRLWIAQLFPAAAVADVVVRRWRVDQLAVLAYENACDPSHYSVKQSQNRSVPCRSHSTLDVESPPTATRIPGTPVNAVGAFQAAHIIAVVGESVSDCQRTLEVCADVLD